MVMLLLIMEISNIRIIVFVGVKRVSFLPPAYGLTFSFILKGLSSDDVYYSLLI